MKINEILTEGVNTHNGEYRIIHTGSPSEVDELVQAINKLPHHGLKDLHGPEAFMDVEAEIEDRGVILVTGIDEYGLEALDELMDEFGGEYSDVTYERDKEIEEYEDEMHTPYISPNQDFYDILDDSYFYDWYKVAMVTVRSQVDDQDWGDEVEHDYDLDTKYPLKLIRRDGKSFNSNDKANAEKLIKAYNRSPYNVNYRVYVASIVGNTAEFMLTFM